MNQSNKKVARKISPDKAREIFEDPEARSNIVGLYDLLFKVAKRNPQLWAEIQGENQKND